MIYTSWDCKFSYRQQVNEFYINARISLEAFCKQKNCEFKFKNQSNYGSCYFLVKTKEQKYWKELRVSDHIIHNYQGELEIITTDGRFFCPLLNYYILKDNEEFDWYSMANGWKTEQDNWGNMVSVETYDGYDRDGAIEWLRENTTESLSNENEINDCLDNYFLHSYNTITFYF